MKQKNKKKDITKKNNKFSKLIKKVIVLEHKMLPEICVLDWPCHCGHRHGKYSFHDLEEVGNKVFGTEAWKELEGKLYGYCRTEGCTCRWYEPMTNLEYVAWTAKKK